LPEVREFIKDTRPKANTTLLKNTIEKEKQMAIRGLLSDPYLVLGVRQRTVCGTCQRR
jgi:hypothetical protein